MKWVAVIGSSLALVEFEPQEVHGIDFCPLQISRVKQVNAATMKRNSSSLFFQQGRAEKTPYKSNTFDKVFSIEAAQHFSSLDAFAKEAYRVLEPEGKLAVAAFFGTTDESRAALSKMVETIENEIDKATPIYHVEQILRERGFKNIKIESIGENVWPGFDRWVSQTEFKNSWTRNWYQECQKDLIDYYIISAEKHKK